MAPEKGSGSICHIGISRIWYIAPISTGPLVLKERGARAKSTGNLLGRQGSAGGNGGSGPTMASSKLCSEFQDDIDSTAPYGMGPPLSPARLLYLKFVGVVLPNPSGM